MPVMRGENPEDLGKESVSLQDLALLFVLPLLQISMAFSIGSCHTLMGVTLCFMFLKYRVAFCVYATSGRAHTHIHVPS